MDGPPQMPQRIEQYIQNVLAVHFTFLFCHLKHEMWLIQRWYYISFVVLFHSRHSCVVLEEVTPCRKVKSRPDVLLACLQFPLSNCRLIYFYAESNFFTNFLRSEALAFWIYDNNMTTVISFILSVPPAVVSLINTSRPIQLADMHTYVVTPLPPYVWPIIPSDLERECSLIRFLCEERSGRPSSSAAISECVFSRGWLRLRWSTLGPKSPAGMRTLPMSTTS